MWILMGFSNLLNPYPNQIELNETIELSPKPNHFFNLEAPMGCVSGIEVSKKKEVLICKFETQGEHFIKTAICDEKKSFCRLDSIVVFVGQESTTKRVLNTFKNTFHNIEKELNGLFK